MMGAPLHAGSYAAEVDGAARTREFRCMVAGLHAAGLRVVLDVVYNHTFHSGPNSCVFHDRGMEPWSALFVHGCID